MLTFLLRSKSWWRDEDSHNNLSCIMPFYQSSGQVKQTTKRQIERKKKERKRKRNVEKGGRGRDEK